MELTIDQALQKGIEAHKAGQVQEADRLYTAILKAQPKHPDANHNMGVLAVGVGKVQESLPFFQTALEVNHSTAQFWLSYIDALMKLDRIADAKAMFDQAKEKGAKAEGFDKLEQRLNGSNEALNETVTNNQEVEQDKPNILNILKLDQAIKLARKKSKHGLAVEAKRIYQDILTKFPKNKKAIDGIKALSGGPIGTATKAQDPSQDQLRPLINLYNQGQFQQALRQASQLLKQFSKSVIVYNINGAANAGLGKLETAVESYKKALAIKPDYAEAYNNMGVTLKEQGKLEEAIEAFNKALTITPDYADAYNNMGVALQDQGKPEEAIEAYNKALNIQPYFADAYVNMGNAFKYQGKLEESVKAFSKAIYLKPDLAEAHNNMGNTLQEQGKLQVAVKAYNKALSIKPDYAEAYNNMGVALKDQGKLEEAVEALNNALFNKLDYAEAYYNMGVALKGLVFQNVNPGGKMATESFG
jgi:tetratricopeptide (TPR) repeat protein